MTVSSELEWMEYKSRFCAVTGYGTYWIETSPSGSGYQLICGSNPCCEVFTSIQNAQLYAQQIHDHPVERKVCFDLSDVDQSPYQAVSHVRLTDLLRFYEIMLTGDKLPKRVAVQTADLRELIEAAHPFRLTVAREQTYAHASRIAETYINGEYEAQGCSAQMIFDELRLLAEPKPSASFGIYLAQIIDEMAVDNFTLRMKEKLAKKRTEGRSGWMDMSADDLSVMLRQHVDKGDPVDVANFCMFLSAHDQNIVPDTKPFDGPMTQEEIQLENLKQMAKYDGQVISFECRDPYYLASCDNCGWVGSSELCGTDSFGDDSDVYCPRCQSSGADCGKVAERITCKPVYVAAVREAAEQLIRNRFDTYTAKNGKRVAIEGDDGEKCWIVSFEDMSVLENAIRAPSPAEPEQGEQLPQDVINLVIAARELVYSGEVAVGSHEAKALDNALEAFASRVPWENEPDELAAPISEAGQ